MIGPETDAFDLVIGRSGTIVERLALGHVDLVTEREHLARYSWATRWSRQRRILDVACGTGYGSKMLIDAGAGDVLGVDISGEALRFAVKTYRITTVQANATILPINNSEFDLAVSFETIEHVTDAQDFLREINRVLRPGGVLLLSTPNSELSAHVNPFHVREYTRSELLAVLQECGFTVTRVLGQRWQAVGKSLTAKLVRRFLRYCGAGYRVSSRIVPFTKPLYWCISARRD